MTDAGEVSKLVSFIEENVRTSPVSGLPFVDSRGLRSRLILKQNHVVFGRRGAGKTSLVRSVAGSANHVDLYVNLEDYKDITFPNILIHVLIKLFTQLHSKLHAQPLPSRLGFSSRGLDKNLSRMLSALEEYVHEPDAETQEVTVTTTSAQRMGASAGAQGIGASAEAGKGRSSQVLRQLPRSKLEYLRLELSAYKDAIGRASQTLGRVPVFLLLDDYYFVPKPMQPLLIDYLHRLTKGTGLYLKVATIKHRTKLYSRSADQYLGVELGHDAIEIDLDYTLDRFDELQSFMRQLLQNAIDQADVRLRPEEIFAGDGFAQLCLASGGVPRDFLLLFIAVATRAIASAEPIGKMQVNEAAIGNLGNKIESMKKDSGDEDAILDDYLKRIKRYVYDEKRRNAFLISKNDLDADTQLRQAIRELVDLRLIHLVDQNTSKAPSDGQRYEAYVIDVALYDNPRPRDFVQIEPGRKDSKARMDDLRAAPVLTLTILRKQLPKIPVQLELSYE